MKKQIRKAMICTIAMMLIGVVSLTGVTYAWFSKSEFATIEGLQMNVLEADGGVYISASPYTGFTTSITFTPDQTLKYDAASTAGTVSGGKLVFFKGSLDHPDDQTLNTEQLTAPSSYYVEKDIYFDNSMGTQELVISLAGTEIAPVSNTATKQPQLAARIAVVTHGSITLAQKDTAQAYPIAPDGVDSVQIYEYRSGAHTDYGYREYSKFIDTTAKKDGDYKYYAVNAAGTDINRFNDGSPSQLTDMTTLKHTDESLVLKRSADDVIIKVPAGSYLKTTIYVWLEGQDADCQNSDSGEPFISRIKFQKVSGGVVETEEPTETTPPAAS